MPKNNAAKADNAREYWNSYLKFHENTPIRKAYPRGEDTKQAIKAVRAALEDAIAKKLRVKVVGSGHSFSDILDAPDVLVDLAGVSFLKPADRARFRGGAATDDNLFEAGAGI